MQGFNKEQIEFMRLVAVHNLNLLRPSGIVICESFGFIDELINSYQVVYDFERLGKEVSNDHLMFFEKILESLSRINNQNSACKCGGDKIPISSNKDIFPGIKEYTESNCYHDKIQSKEVREISTSELKDALNKALNPDHFPHLSNWERYLVENVYETDIESLVSVNQSLFLPPKPPEKKLPSLNMDDVVSFEDNLDRKIGFHIGGDSYPGGTLVSINIEDPKHAVEGE